MHLLLQLIYNQGGCKKGKLLKGGVVEKRSRTTAVNSCPCILQRPTVGQFQNNKAPLGLRPLDIGPWGSFNHPLYCSTFLLRPRSREDFSDDDDVPLTKFKPDDSGKRDEQSSDDSDDEVQEPKRKKEKEEEEEVLKQEPDAGLKNEEREADDDLEKVGGSDDDDDSDSDDSYNNPNRLWCICREPHNNRLAPVCAFGE